jgi:hypothetical protein
MSAFHEVDAVDLDDQSLGILEALESVGVTAAVTSWHDESIVNLFWRTDRARECRGIAIALADEYSTGKPNRGAGPAWERLGFLVVGGEDEARSCCVSFMSAALEAAA